MTESRYYVWSPSDGSPTKNHPTVAQARAESHRLCCLPENYGKEFLVLRAIESVTYRTDPLVRKTFSKQGWSFREKRKVWNQLFDFIEQLKLFCCLAGLTLRVNVDSVAANAKGNLRRPLNFDAISANAAPRRQVDPIVGLSLLLVTRNCQGFKQKKMASSVKTRCHHKIYIPRLKGKRSIPKLFWIDRKSSKQSVNYWDIYLCPIPMMFYWVLKTFFLIQARRA